MMNTLKMILLHRLQLHHQQLDKPRLFIAILESILLYKEVAVAMASLPEDENGLSYHHDHVCASRFRLYEGDRSKLYFVPSAAFRQTVIAHTASPLTAEFHLSIVQNIIRHCIERSSNHSITDA